MSVRNCSRSPLFTPKLRMKSASTSGITDSDTSVGLEVHMHRAGRPTAARASRPGSRRRLSFSSPLAMPTSAFSISLNMHPGTDHGRAAFSTPSAGRRSSPACDQVSSVDAGRPAGRRAVDRLQVRRCRRRFSIIWSMSASSTSAVCAHDFELATVDVAEIRHHLERRPRRRARRRRLAPGSMRGLPAICSSFSRTALRRSSRAAVRRGPRCGPAGRNAARSPWPAPCRGGSP